MNKKNYAMFIDGKWVEAKDGRSITVLDPATAEAIASIAAGSEQDVNAAVAAARRAFEGAWGATSATERGRLLSRLATRILLEQESLAAIEAADTGKTMTTARNDIIACARYLEFYGGAADKVHGETLPYAQGYHVAVLKEPHGVTGHILPWNYPAQMFGRSLAPALAVGNAVVLKPAEEACMSILELARLAHETGFPAGTINVVTGIGVEVGAALAAHPDVNFISFTGSPEVGALIQQAAAKHYAACVLELGGKSPQIVFADADLAKAATKVVAAVIQNTGQTCSAGSRVLVESRVFEQFTSMVAEQFSRLVAGPPEENCDCGPLISAKQQTRVKAFIDQGLADGLPVLAQGKLSENINDAGFYVEPVFFGPVPRDHLLAYEEVFGPVLVALPFEDEQDAIALANGTEYGLVAGVWTANGARQMRLAKRLHCGQVFINDYGAGGGVELPFGGVKKSGHGREKGLAALDEFCITKTVVINHS